MRDEYHEGHNTYSWGNDPDPKNQGIAGRWLKDESEDLAAAGAVLLKGWGTKAGGRDLDPYIESAFNRHANNASDPSNHFNWMFCCNCKAEADNLVDEAKRDKQRKEDVDRGGKLAPGLTQYMDDADARIGA